MVGYNDVIRGEHEEWEGRKKSRESTEQREEENRAMDS
jgi:hypothetical protein